MGRWKAFIPIVVALAIASAGSLLLHRWLQAKAAPKELVRVESDAVPVAVAAVNLPWGTKLKREMIKTVPYLTESLPGGYCTDPGTLEGRITITPLEQNEAVTEAKLAPKTLAQGGVSAILKPGKRAIAVKGDKVIGLSGFIVPGSVVDVLVTLTDPRTKSEITKIVLEKIPVLATGTEVQENDKGEPAPVDVYTLEVTPEEGEKLALAATEGKIQFALRNITDAGTVLTRGATIPETLASLREPEPQPKPVVKKNNPKPRPTKRRWVRTPKDPPKPKKHMVTIEVIHGDEVSTKEFEL
jgi:pilus assembly protein CpaB